MRARPCQVRASRASHFRPLAVVILALSATSALADCMYRQQFFSAGAVSCQGGAQYRCVKDSWQATGLDCADTQGDEEGLHVDPSRQAPKVREHGIAQPPSPAVPQD
jgi:hypothetical protein